MRSRAQHAFGVFAVCVYAYGVLVAPVLHRLHHLAHGADHRHTALGTIYEPAGESAGPLEPAASEADHHALLDRSLAELGLTDVAFAGTALVDCAYAEYTLVACPNATPSHPHTFGDELLARQHHHSHPEDPLHGIGSPEHLCAFAISSHAFVLAPPVYALEQPVVAVMVTRAGEHAPVAPPIRGPPLAG